MSYLPMPVRVAVGLMVTAVEQARKLPEQLADLPVTAASHAVQAGMRVQQRLTALAIKGDQVFSLLRPVEDTPQWARFDEDLEPTPPGTIATAGSSGGSPDRVPVVPGHGGVPDESDIAQGLTPPHATADGAARVTPSLLTDYDGMSLTHLRTKLRGFSLPQLEELLEHERAHQDRPAFVTLLSNRISTVRSQ